jgi:hypothetical protein
MGSALTASQRQLRIDDVQGDRLPAIDELAALVEARAAEQLPATRLLAAS